MLENKYLYHFVSPPPQSGAVLTKKGGDFDFAQKTLNFAHSTWLSIENASALSKMQSPCGKYLWPFLGGGVSKDAKMQKTLDNRAQKREKMS